MYNANNNVNPGVKCDVCSCAYNKDGCTCSAEKIHVGTKGADCCSDTRCDTFEEK